jgi:hypothetical protein
MLIQSRLYWRYRLQDCIPDYEFTTFLRTCERLSAASRPCRNFRWRSAAVHFITEGIQHFHSARNNTSLLVPLKSHENVAQAYCRQRPALGGLQRKHPVRILLVSNDRNFRRVRKTSKSYYWLLVCPSRLSLDGFSWNLTWMSFFFRKYVEKIQVSLKSDMNNGTVRYGTLRYGTVRYGTLRKDIWTF